MYRIRIGILKLLYLLLKMIWSGVLWAHLISTDLMFGWSNSTDLMSIPLMAAKSMNQSNVWSNTILSNAYENIDCLVLCLGKLLEIHFLFVLSTICRNKIPSTRQSMFLICWIDLHLFLYAFDCNNIRLFDLDKLQLEELTLDQLNWISQVLDEYSIRR